MNTVIIEGGNPLVGSVKLSGAKNSALKLIPAALFSNEDVFLENVPQVNPIKAFCEVINSMGGKAEWKGSHKLLLNGSGLNTSEVPFVENLPYRVVCLLAGPLIFRFGKAIIPKSFDKRLEKRPINRFKDTWRSLGYIVNEDDDFVRIESGNIAGATINFKISTHSGTDNAIISSIFATGETVITNAAEEVEIEDLIDFLNLIGGEVSRVGPREIRVIGKNIFKGCKFEIQPDKNEAVIFAVAAVVTNGNISIEGIDKSHLTSFVNTLTKIGCKYEFSGKEMRVWTSGEQLLPVDIVTAPAPGFMTDWQPVITLLLTKASGVSTVHDTVYTNRFGYIKDLNRMGAKIDLLTPSQAGLSLKLSDDSYDFQKLGEPFTVAKITGPIKLKGTKLDLWDLNFGPALLLSALCAEGRSEVGSVERIEGFYENFLERLTSLGAKIIKAE